MATPSLGLKNEYWRLYSTTRVEAHRGGRVVGRGTGFFHALATEFGPHRTLITNRHVVDGADRVTFEVRVGFHHESGALAPGDRTITISSSRPLEQFLRHPDGLDLCAVPIEGALSSAATRLPKPWCPLVVNSDEGHVASAALMARMGVFEHVLMLGHPIGLLDPLTRLPILRRGITAYHPSLDWGGKPVGVVDIAAYPGSSGSPIWAVRETTRPGPEGPYSIHYEEKLLGVLYGGPIYAANGTMEIQEVPTAAVPVPQVPLPVHLGFYVKATALAGFAPPLSAVLRDANRPGVDTEDPA